MLHSSKPPVSLHVIHIYYSVFQNSRLLRCYTSSNVKLLPTFLLNVQLPSSWSSCSRNGILDSEVGSATLLLYHSTRRHIKEYLSLYHLCCGNKLLVACGNFWENLPIFTNMKRPFGNWRTPQLRIFLWAGISQSEQWLITSWMVRGPDSGVVEVFCAIPDRPLGPPVIGWFPGVKRPGRGIDHSSPI